MALADAGFAAYAIDVRGHGESGVKGQIAYVGQLEDDVESRRGGRTAAPPPAARVLERRRVRPARRTRVAGGERQRLFDGYVLLSPLFHQRAPTYRPGGGGWVSVGVPRIVALTILDRLGFRWFADLPVIAYAVEPHDRDVLTPSYSYTLATNFRPHEDWRGDVRSAAHPIQILVGANDELFRPERFAEAFAGRAGGGR